MRYSLEKDIAISGVKFSQMELFNIICDAMYYAIPYRAEIDNTTEAWKNATGNGDEEKLFNILLNGGIVKLNDSMDKDESQYYFDLESFKDGIKKTIETGFWNGTFYDYTWDTVGYIVQNAIFGGLHPSEWWKSKAL